MRTHPSSQAVLLQHPQFKGKMKQGRQRWAEVRSCPSTVPTAVQGKPGAPLGIRQEMAVAMTTVGMWMEGRVDFRDIYERPAPGHTVAGCGLEG